MFSAGIPILNDLATILTIELQDELTKQGHNNTGKLHDSIMVELKRQADTTVIRGKAQFYGKNVDKGRKPGGKRIPLKVLEKWVKSRGIATGVKKIRGIAFLIQRAIWTHGSPTPGAFKFSKNTKRLEWISSALDRQDRRMEEKITDAVTAEFDALLERVTADQGGR